MPEFANGLREVDGAAVDINAHRLINGLCDLRGGHTAVQAATRADADGNEQALLGKPLTDALHFKIELGATPDFNTTAGIGSGQFLRRRKNGKSLGEQVVASEAVFDIADVPGDAQTRRLIDQYDLHQSFLSAKSSTSVLIRQASLHGYGWSFGTPHKRQDYAPSGAA